MAKPARPTLRCLTDDLDEDWRSPEHRNAAASDPVNISTELHLLDHPVISKAAHDFDGTPVAPGDVKREGITDLSDPMWFKLKTGRWRGAVLEDPDGQAWLCAAGYRRGKESTDFYQAFMANVAALGPDYFLPTREDRDRLADELAEERFVEWEKNLVGAAREWMFEARQTGMVSETLLDPDGNPLGSVSIAYLEESLDGDEMLVDIYLEFLCSDWSQVQLMDWAETATCLSIDPHEQIWRPTHVAGGRAYSFVLTEDEAAEFYRAMEGPLRRPGETVAGSESHWTHRERLTESTVMGHAVMGLCGRWFVPRQDSVGKPECPQCEAIHQRMSG